MSEEGRVAERMVRSVLPPTPHAFGLKLSNPIEACGLEGRTRCFGSCFPLTLSPGHSGHLAKNYEALPSRETDSHRDRLDPCVVLVRMEVIITHIQRSRPGTRTRAGLRKMYLESRESKTRMEMKKTRRRGEESSSFSMKIRCQFRR